MASSPLNSPEGSLSGRNLSDTYLYTYKKETAWQAYQSDFFENRRKKRLLQKYVRVFLTVVIPGLLILGAWHLLGLDSFFKQGARQAILPPPGTETPQPPKTMPAKTIPPITTLSKTGVSDLIRETRFLNADKNVFFVDSQDQQYTITTSLNTPLQKELISAMNQLKTLDRGKPQQIAIIAMDPSNGNIVGMAGFDLGDPGINPCLASDYPAASIFKIVTAAAAIDSLGYSAHTPLYFNGNKYTLYKRQLTDDKNKYTTKISLAGAFAESINPIFGKIGKTYLEKGKLNAYAQAFGFNQRPDSELKFESGRFGVKENEFHLAELGCGYNHDTTISPVFGAMLVTTVLNAGTSFVPHIVNQVKTSMGDIIYTSKKETYATPITPKTAQTMIELMKTTIAKGTARKSFHGISRDRTLSKLDIGGKTGSLYNRERTVKYDWFTGFGKEKTGDKALVMSIVVGHKKYIGTRASSYARMILKTYFKDVSKAPAQKK